jgi:hypothetical protein
MKKKDEMLVDSRLNELGITPKIYHFDIPMYPFRTITVADTRWSWDELRRIIYAIATGPISKIVHGRSTLMMQELRDRRIFGVAICEHRDQLNRPRGRTIAKGRLWKHLKEKER